jgi:transposase
VVDTVSPFPSRTKPIEKTIPPEEECCKNCGAADLPLKFYYGAGIRAGRYCSEACFHDYCAWVDEP